MAATATALPAGYRRQAYSSVSSTSEVALEAARRGDPGRLWITAEQQSKGRGRRGRQWHSPPGNLYASLYLADPGPVEATATLAFAAGVALHQALDDCVGPGLAGRLALKWPNDLLADGRKIAGILLDGEALEGDRLAVVIGIGVNCVSHPDIDAAHQATDLAALGIDLGPDRLFHCLSFRLAENLEAWCRGDGFAAIRQGWMERAYGVGAPLRIAIDDRVIEGSFDDLDSAGRLLVKTTDGRRLAVSAGDVFFSPAS